MKNVSKKLTISTEKIAKIADNMLVDDGHTDWKIDEIHLIPKTADGNGKVICKNVYEDGKWVLKCDNV